MDTKKDECEYISSQIIREHSQWYNIKICTSDSERCELILSFFRLTKNLNLQTRTKERVILFYDKCSWDTSFSQDFKKIFLVSILNLYIKIESGSEQALKVLKKLIDISTQINLNYSNSSNFSYPRLKLIDVYNAELFVLNSIDWNFSLFTFSEYLDFFQLFLQKKILLEEKEIKKLIEFFINFYSECSLVCFNTSKLPLHQKSLVIITFSLFELKVSNELNYNEKVLVEILLYCKKQFMIHLSSMFDYIKIFYNFLIKIKIKIYDEGFIRKIESILQRVNILYRPEKPNFFISTYPFMQIKTKRKLSYSFKKKNQNLNKMFLLAKEYVEVQGYDLIRDCKKNLTKKFIEDKESDKYLNIQSLISDSKGI
jgi:hypothetical protein